MFCQGRMFELGSCLRRSTSCLEAVEFGHFIGDRCFDQSIPKVGNNIGRGAQPFRLGADILDHLRLARLVARSEEHTSELQSLMRISYAVFCLKKKKHKYKKNNN